MNAELKEFLIKYFGLFIALAIGIWVFYKTGSETNNGHIKDKQ